MVYRNPQACPSRPAAPTVPQWICRSRPSCSSLFTLHSSQYEEIADIFLFDTKCKCVGGSGEQFDWDILQHYKGDTPFLLSGGIGPGDEEKVRRWCHPRWVGIDLNSRFESAPAYKDAQALAKFVKGLSPTLSKGEGEIGQ